MKSSRSKNTFLNTVAGIGLQTVVAVNGLIVPRIIIKQYGSDVNGVVVSITQFLSYITLLDGGVGQVFRSSLYKPLVDGNMEEVSGIINAQKSFYRKIALIFLVYIAGLCALYPIFAKTEMGRGYVIALILIMSVSCLLENFVSFPYSSLVTADQRVRVPVTISAVLTVLNFSLIYVLAHFEVSILILKLGACALMSLRPIILTIYVSKNYKLSKEVKAREDVLNQRWNGLVHHCAYYVHNNTDVAILTLAVGTTSVSVYSLYWAIVNGLQYVINAFSNGAAASVGNLLSSSDKENIDSAIDLYEFVASALTTVIYTITALMLIPFMKLYTANVSDINYIYPAFGYVMVIANAIYCYRCIYSTIYFAANKYKETQIGAIVECAINLTLSIVCVIIGRNIGMKLFGIAAGTLIGMLIRYLIDIAYLSKNVVCRPMWKALKSLLTGICISGISIAICKLFINYNIESVSGWIMIAILSGLIVGSVALIIYLLLYRKQLKDIFKRVLKKVNK